MKSIVSLKTPSSPRANLQFLKTRYSSAELGEPMAYLWASKSVFHSWFFGLLSFSLPSDLHRFRCEHTRDSEFGLVFQKVRELLIWIAARVLEGHQISPSIPVIQRSNVVVYIYIYIYISGRIPVFSSHISNFFTNTPSAQLILDLCALPSYPVWSLPVCAVLQDAIKRQISHGTK